MHLQSQAELIGNFIQVVMHVWLGLANQILPVKETKIIDKHMS